MKRISLQIILLTVSLFTVLGQNPVTIGSPEDINLFINSGQNFILIPDVNDNDAGDQSVTFTVTSDDTDVLSIDGVDFTPGNTFAIIHVTEKGKPDTVTIDIEADDTDGTASASLQVFVIPYNNPGVNFEIHDAVFWQQVVPLDANPAFSMIAADGVAPYDDIDLPSLELSVYSDCETSPPCTGTDFFTAMFKGWVIPPASGDYTFYVIAGDQCSFGLSTDENFDNIDVILHSSNGIGTNLGNKEWGSVVKSLEAGQPYAFYATHWNIHTFIGGILWEGPEISKDYIRGQYLSYVHDVTKPATPGNLALVTTGITDIEVAWDAASDDKMLSGYNVYVSGKKVNTGTISTTEYLITDLDPDNKYSIAVTSVDMAGNESPVSNIVSSTTYAADANPPGPPAVISALIISDLSVKLEWSGATESETEIRGYNIYVDGNLYNTGEYVKEEMAVITDLAPETLYGIQIETVDAGYNVSAKSTVYNVTTASFDPVDTQLTDKKGRVTVSMEAIGYNAGLGINPNFLHGEFVNDPEQVKLINELAPAAIRWGALTANPLSFEDYIGSEPSFTIADFMNFCNQIDAYTVFTCGVEDGTDWRQDPETFAHYLEYIAGPSDSEYGSIRASEGYTGSLLDASKGLVFEFGNEVWGASAHDAQIGSDYVVYGEWCREMATLMKSSSNYDPDKIFLVYSGRRPHPSNSYGLHDKLLNGDTGQVDWLSLSGYLGGNLQYAPEIDPGASELDYMKNGIATVEHELEGMVMTMQDEVEYTGELKPSYLYESNMTQNTYFGRVGQAIIQTDYYASAVETGSALPTIFHLTGGQWKMVIPAQDYKKTTLFYTAAFYNNYCKGNILKTDLVTMAKIEDSDGDTLDFEPIGCYAYTEGEKYSILFFSRDFEHDFTMQVDIPDDLQLIAPETGKKYVITGNHFSDRDPVIDSSTVTISDSLLVTVPRYSMVLLTFGGDDQELEPLPLGYYAHKSATEITIIPYNSDEMDLTVNGAKKIYMVESSPEDVFSDHARWSVDTTGVEALYMVKKYGIDILGSGTCDGNGSITLRAEAWDDPSVYDEVTIRISNQGSGCGTAVQNVSSPRIIIYPNPVSNILFIQNLDVKSESYLEIFDAVGRKYFSQAVREEIFEVKAGEWNQGVYYLRISSPGGVENRIFIKQ